MRGSTHIVECLRNKGVNPKVIDTKYFDNNLPEYGIVYDKQNLFHSKPAPEDTWTLDFKKKVFIKGYQIIADQKINSVRNWNFYSKNENGNFDLIESHQNNIAPGDGIHFLEKPINTQYVKLKGGPTWSGGNCLAFYYVKFFGNTRREEITCRSPTKSKNFIFNIVFLLIYS